MKIDDSIVKQYIFDGDNTSFKNYWIFYSIEEGQYLFEKPDLNLRNDIREIYEQVYNAINNFRPYNEQIFKDLFPNYQEVINKAQVILVVGCPKPYDAMFISKDNVNYIVFDIVRINDYVIKGVNLEHLLNTLLTHEFCHHCIHYSYHEKTFSYIEQLNWNIFDEGLAHLLSYKDDITLVDFNEEEYENYYQKAITETKLIVSLKDEKDQQEALIKGVTGSYWDKYLAILGKIYFGKNLKQIKAIYDQGYQSILNTILEVNYPPLT